MNREFFIEDLVNKTSHSLETIKEILGISTSDYASDYDSLSKNIEDRYLLFIDFLSKYSLYH